MNEELEELLKDIKSYRNDMVARNYPFQEISNIITKWEMKNVPGAVAPSQTQNFLEEKTVSEELQDELEPITNKKETKRAIKAAVDQAKECK